MRILLDTHTLIWWSTSSANIPERVLELLDDRGNDVLLSIASVWEIQIKCQSGKLQLSKPISIATPSSGSGKLDMR
jgi:PIN domain nuclease of toxin-antitoxin system